jgi:hypothetical protein
VRTPELEPPLTLVCSDRHVQMEGYPIEQGAEIEISLLPPGSRGCATRSNQASPAPCSNSSNPWTAIASRLAIEPMLQAERIRRNRSGREQP